MSCIVTCSSLAPANVLIHRCTAHTLIPNFKLPYHDDHDLAKPSCNPGYDSSQCVTLLHGTFQNSCTDLQITCTVLY